jgi:hypothetical protein
MSEAGAGGTVEQLDRHEQVNLRPGRPRVQLPYTQPLATGLATMAWLQHRPPGGLSTALALLVTATVISIVISVYKPWGGTPLGRRCH